MQRIEASCKRKDTNRCVGAGLGFQPITWIYIHNNVLVFMSYSRAGHTMTGNEWGNYVNTRELCKAAKSVRDIAKLLDQEPTLHQIKVAYHCKWLHARLHMQVACWLDWSPNSACAVRSSRTRVALCGRAKGARLRTTRARGRPARHESSHSGKRVPGALFSLATCLDAREHVCTGKQTVRSMASSACRSFLTSAV